MYIVLVALLIIYAKSCISLENGRPEEFNVGFDLKLSYGTAAVSDPNGTIVATVKVSSTPEYQETVRKLSLWSSAHIAPPYMTPQERQRDYSRQQQRQARKAQGLPASEDVAALSTLIVALKKETERQLGNHGKIQFAAASVPRIPGLYDEDLYDTFDYAGLQYLQIMQRTYHKTLLTYASGAAVAGHGLALCPKVTHPSQCDVSDLQGIYFVVEYTKYGLFAYHTLARSAYYVIDRVYFDWELGSQARKKNPDEKYYWNAMRKVLLRPLIETDYEKPTKIILVGEEESVQDTAFLRELDSILKEFFKSEMPEIVAEDPEYVQAKGVAELVRRRPYLPTPIKPERIARTGHLSKGEEKGLKLAGEVMEQMEL